MSTDGSKRKAKIYVRLAEKVSDNNYGSVEVCHGLELEIEFNSAAEFLRKAESIRRMLDQAIQQGLDEYDETKRPTDSQKSRGKA